MSEKLVEMVRALSRSPPAGREVLVTPKVTRIASPSLRILIADDSATDRQIALALLRRLGQQADLVVDGSEAAKAARQRPYDVILMDLSMPTLDGIQATRLIMKNQPGPPPHIVAMTGGRAAGQEECTAAGMLGYLPKPVRLDQLAAILDACREARIA